MNMEWKKSEKSFMVNIYYIKKMLSSEETIEDVIEMMKESYENDNHKVREYKNDYKVREYKNVNFKEYVNEKRCFLASVLGLPQYF